MKNFLRITIFPAALTAFFICSSSTGTPSFTVNPGDNDSTVFAKIYSEALQNGEAWKTLDGLCKAAPSRLSGSPGAQKAVEYMQKVMQDYHFDKVWLQPCMVPHWVRGNPEVGKIVDAKTGKKITVNVCALGGSLATDPKGLTAEVVEVHNFDELDKLGAAGIKGKIVFYNHPFDDTKFNTFSAYGEAVQYRWQGPRNAENYGAVGVIVRSMTSYIDTFPHTGVMRSDSLAAKIPSAAISTADANQLDAMLQKNGSAKFFLKMNCKWLPDEKSFNVIGEILGSDHPDQVIVVGGHLDAWELGQGANDDGSGCVQAIEALRIFKTLGIRPKHTIRAVMWMNEENGGRGGKAYADSTALSKTVHIAAIESDEGSFAPRGFGLDMTADQKKKVQNWTPLFFPYGVYDFTHGGSGADIEGLGKTGIPLLGLEPDCQRYFIYHHTEIDNMKGVNPRELHLCSATLAAMIYMIDKYGL